MLCVHSSMLSGVGLTSRWYRIWQQYSSRTTLCCVLSSMLYIALYAVRTQLYAVWCRAHFKMVLSSIVVFLEVSRLSLLWVQDKWSRAGTRDCLGKHFAMCGLYVVFLLEELQSDLNVIAATVSNILLVNTHTGPSLYKMCDTSTSSNVRNCQSYTSFLSRLKTHYFNTAFISDQWSVSCAI